MFLIDGANLTVQVRLFGQNANSRMFEMDRLARTGQPSTRLRKFPRKKHLPRCRRDGRWQKDAHILDLSLRG